MATEKDLAIPVEPLDRLIHEIRGHKVMLDRDLATLYGVETKNLNKAVRRNVDRFPTDFMFQLTQAEAAACLGSRFQFGTLKRGQNIKYLPYAFTEQGVAMLSSVLRSKRAMQVNILIMRAFVRMRAALSGNRELARTLAALERELKDRLNVHEAAIVTVLQRVMDIIDPPALPEPPKKQIGFRVKEARGRYVARRNGNGALRG
jgi:phage regulator Rha-like protein